MQRSSRTGQVVPPDIVASAANGFGTDASSSAGYPSHPPSGSASPHAYRKVDDYLLLFNWELEQLYVVH